MHPPRRRTTVLLAVVGGLLTDASFPGTAWWPLAFVGVALLLLALDRDSARWNLVVGAGWGLAFFLPQLSWIVGAVGSVPWVALCVAEAGFVGLFGAAWTWARRGRVIRTADRWQVPAVAVVWTAMEEARSVMPFGGFPWGRLAFSQADSPIGRLAWAGGAPLVSVAVVLVAALLAVAVRRVRRLDIGLASGAVLLAGAVLVMGLAVPLDSAAQDGRLKVAAVQGDVPDRGLDSLDQAREVVRNHEAGSIALLGTVAPGELDLLLWPENSADFDPRTDPQTQAIVEKVTGALDVPLLLGTQSYPDTGGRYNLGMLWEHGVGPVAIYAKQHPVPFAEYIPMREVARRFSSAVDRVRTDMLPGHGVGLIPVDVPRLGRTVGIADVICFEVAYDDIVRSAVTAGGELLVVQTNNATFGHTDESTQQLAMSRLRAMELGRATVQISTVGVSAIIAPNGAMTDRTGLFTAAHMVAALPLRTSLTPAARFGDEISWALRGLGVAIVVVGMAGAWRRRRDPAEDRRPATRRQAAR
ncbi:apolipoprotein N-acyltransferase [Isoptericola sp. b441]|uniref:Apolipoprotein N-acyltransferase n=1 Tax=Actinotalea lenta TaxID=3064654 RepID=A0ABT9DA51_9CELL|nr:apolipoprotein N-acyltransferase [Isoptericola sp. b441]MDO8107746.1 apolipoprotein N-acyltransferase [Isoptericola sp. b441]